MDIPRSDKRVSPVGKDPPMPNEIPLDVEDLMLRAIPDLKTRIEAKHALALFLQYLRDNDREKEAERVISETRMQLQKDATELETNKRRARFRVHYNLIVPALSGIIAKVVIDLIHFS